ncbi:MAG: hypothetical protein M3Y87_15695, partial [Myxococcota bacterium]|nr:hypothetical protein [Myxococcota bacterium]
MDRIARWGREPLLRFALVGLAIFAVDRALAGGRGEAERDRDPQRILIDDAFVDALRARWTERHGRAPDAEEHAAIVRAQVREEALVREARAAGLDEGDAIVRRRLVQKIEFVVAGSIEVEEPDDAALEAWLESHPDDFRRPARTTIEHVLFARDRREERAEADARAALDRLRANPSMAQPEALGDAFLRGHTIGPATDVQLAGALGEEAARAIVELAPGAW